MAKTPENRKNEGRDPTLAFRGSGEAAGLIGGAGRAKGTAPTGSSRRRRSLGGDGHAALAFSVAGTEGQSEIHFHSGLKDIDITFGLVV